MIPFNQAFFGPGEYHQFEAVEDTVAFELYWAEFDHEDIERETVGFNK